MSKAAESIGDIENLDYKDQIRPRERPLNDSAPRNATLSQEEGATTTEAPSIPIANAIAIETITTASHSTTQQTATGTNDAEETTATKKETKQQRSPLLQSKILWPVVSVLLILIVIGGFCGAGKCKPNDDGITASATTTQSSSTTTVQPPSELSVVVGTIPCETDSDCPTTGECAKESLTGTKVCCSSGQSVWAFSSLFCTGHPVGALCDDTDKLCASGICSSNNQCSDLRQPSGGNCRRNGHCESLSCVQGVCAESIAQPGEACDDNDDCWQSTCAQATLAGTSTICCPTGDSTYVSSPFSKYVCTGQADGAMCADEDELCASGLCFQQTCLSSRQPIGEACGENSHCESFVCVNGVCVDGLVESGGTCDSSDDCSLGSCAHETLSGPLVCCSSGDSTYVSSPHSKYVCTGQAEGALCDNDDDVCSSRICYQGVCLAEPQPAGSGCSSNSHCQSLTCVDQVCLSSFSAPGEPCDDRNDCTNRVCGLDSVGGSLVCCATNDSEYLFSPISEEVCTGQLEGALCGNKDSVCASGSCSSSGVCQ